MYKIINNSGRKIIMEKIHLSNNSIHLSNKKNNKNKKVAT
jgi:hypothetical protein